MTTSLVSTLASKYWSAESVDMSSSDMQLAQYVKIFLWTTYDPDDKLIYPTVSNWDDLLAETIEVNGYATLTKDEVLSILFGLQHRNRIIEGLWWSFFERGIAQKLLNRLKEVEADELG